MGCIWSRKDDDHIQPLFSVSFNAMLIPLFNHYRRVVRFLKQTNLFGRRSLQLEYLVATYLSSPNGLEPHSLKPQENEVDPEKMALCAIHATHKLHPLDFQTDLVCDEWLIKACLKHQKFVRECELEGLYFEDAFRKYIQFLYLCYKSPTATIIPRPRELFMWHSHMQDNRAYKIDMMKTVGRVLELKDQMTAGELKTHKLNTRNARRMYLPAFRARKHNEIRDKSSEEDESEEAALAV